MQVRKGSLRWADLKVLETSYAITATSEFAGAPDLLERLPLQKEGNRMYIVVATDREHTPEVQNGRLKTYIEPVSASLNAYPKYLDLFEGGLDIAVHVGSDYNEPRLDTPHAHSLYDHLVSQGFRSPVSRFEALALNSPPLVRTIRVKDKNVPVRVRIVHELMAPQKENQDVLIEEFSASAKGADVVIYDGHADSSFPILKFSKNGSHAKDLFIATEFKNLAVTDKQQIYFFNGCLTYSLYSDAVYANPKRTTKNTDIISSLGEVTMFPEARPVIAFIDALLGIPEGTSLSPEAPWLPNSFSSILSRLDKGDWNDAYGVHGLDDNPTLSPLADVSTFGRPCREDADCGGLDRLCV